MRVWFFDLLVFFLNNEWVYLGMKNKDREEDEEHRKEDEDYVFVAYYKLK